MHNEASALTNWPGVSLCRGGAPILRTVRAVHRANKYHAFTSAHHGLRINLILQKPTERATMTRPNAPLSGPSRGDQQKPTEPTPTPTSHREKRKARKRRNSVAELTSPLTRIASQTDELSLTRRRSRKSSAGATVPVPVSISRIETPSITRPMSRANLPLRV